jgi:two-component system cell cycle sensor histidine kinase/response regulator CckA
MAVNHHLRLALDQVSDAVIVVEGGPLEHPGPRVLYANEAMAEATGVPSAQLVSLPLASLCDGEVLLQMLTALSDSNGGAVECKAHLKHLHARPTPCRWSAVRVHDGHGATLNYIFTASPDLGAAGLPAKSPDKSDAPDPAEKAEPKDESPPAPGDYQADLVETIRDTARYVAHEFNNALTAILLPVQVAIREVPGGSDLHAKLQVAYESARRAADLAKDFLDCFRPRPAVRERCRIASLLGRAMRLATCAQNINWSLEVADDLLDAEVDCNQIERVIFNLVRNASQAMPGGGKLLVKASNAVVEASSEHPMAPGAYVHISVRDWGPGIAEEHLQHLFSSRFTTKDNGNGCGLPICYQIVRDHGGDMYVKSRPNVGTAFLIFLPAIAPKSALSEMPLPPIVVKEMPEEAEEQKTVSESPPASVSDTPPTLLVVDDEAILLRAFQQIATACGFDVTAVSTSEEGMQHYRDRFRSNRPFDSVLLDINLRGGKSGEEVFEDMRRLAPAVPIIATSGQFTDSDLERYENLGFAGFLPKPFTVDQFDQVMSEVLAA